MSRRQIRIAIVFALIIAAALWIYFSSKTGDISDRISADQTKSFDELDAVQKKADEYVRNYRADIGDLTNLDEPAELLIKLMPVVKQTTIAGSKKPAKRIIHICDWHLVSPEEYHIDQEHARGAPVTKAESDKSYRAFVHEVAAVQIEQLALLRMFRRHGGQGSVQRGVRHRT